MKEISGRWVNWGRTTRGLVFIEENPRATLIVNGQRFLKLTAGVTNTPVCGTSPQNATALFATRK
jgi:hypothetical protein